MEFPLIKKDTFPAAYPNDEKCPICGAPFSKRKRSNGIVYIEGGGILYTKSEADSIHTKRLAGFLGLGYHSGISDSDQSCHFELVDDVEGGQFEIAFCSTMCLEAFFQELVERIRRFEQRDLTDGRRAPAES